MKQTTTRKEVRLEWITPAPALAKRAAMLVPQFNEASHFNIIKRLRYFQELSLRLPEDVDLILIDDGSTDDSLTLILEFLQAEGCNFYVAAIYPNTNKVGALYLTTLQLQHEMIILSDFDTDLYGYENLSYELSLIAQDPNIMGAYFRMLPFEGNGKIFLFQQIEYSLARSLYKFHKGDQSVPVMPGAGSCYKRDLLVKIFEQHSGLRSGEDRESTLIGLKMGYGAKYVKNILTLTRPPLTLKALVKQRVRWNLGHIETFAKEKEYYLEQIKKLTRIGKRSIYDIGVVTFMMLLPLIIGCSIILNPKFLFEFAAATYLVYVLWCIGLIMFVPNESQEFKKNRNFSILIYPFFKLIVDYVAWAGALIQFYKKHRSQRAYYASFVLKQLHIKSTEAIEDVVVSEAVM